MFSNFKSKINNYIVTLRFSLLAIFISLFIIMMLVVYSIFTLHVHALLLQAGLLLMARDSEAAMHELNLQLQPAFYSSTLTANNIRSNIIDPKNQAQMATYLVHLLKNLSLANAVYWADANGNFYFAKRLENGLMTATLNREIKPVNNVYSYFDKHHKEIKRVSVPPDFDPRHRPWYQQAIAKKSSMWTDPYIYSSSPIKLGITLATPVFQQQKILGVFGIDISLDELNQFLVNQVALTHAEVFIFDKVGSVIVPPTFIKSELLPVQNYELRNVHGLNKPWVAQAFEIYQKNPKAFFAFKDHEENYLASFTSIPLLQEKGWTLAIVDKAADFTRPLRKAEIFYVLLLVSVFAFAIFLISLLVSRIIKPIKKLVKETEKIKMFNLDETEKVTSRIKEVIEISDAIYSMKTGLRSFQKYVPASLVRQLIKAGEDVKLGGKKEELAIFFSDIKDFTSITEKMDANQLMKQVCEYFDAFSHVISKESGTIDKFIGDAIMAFWGAPSSIKHPCVHAAHAALDCLQQQMLLNAQWAEMNIAPFYSRIGLHYGMVIVGNLGSSERLNYTVLGDTVNIASRLVDANKFYGTAILVSESFYQQVKDDFILRMVDKVTLKGKAETTAIYELLAENKNQLNFDIEAYRQQFANAIHAYETQQWLKAIELFEQCLKIFSEDTLATIFIKRCQDFIVHPPEKNWDGVWHLIEK